MQICQWYRVCDAGALRAEPLATLYILRGHKNGHLDCEMGKKEEVPARVIFVQGSL